MTHKNIDIPTAVFIDGGWLYGATRRINQKIDFAKFFNALIKKFGAETRVYYYGTVDPTNKQQERFYRSLQKIGYIIHCTKVRKVGDKVISSGLDISLAVDAMRILSSLTNFVLISGDGDFVALLQQASRIGVNTYVIALPFSIGYLLRKVANNFLNLETLTAEYKPRTLKVEAKIEKFVSQNYIKKGESFRSYIKLRNLMKSAKNNINIIDQYLDDQILTTIQLLETDISITIFTNKISPEDFCLQVKKLRDEGRSITVYKTNIFHARFLGIDNTWWHSDHSFKDLGQKDSMITKVTEKSTLNKLIDRIAKVSQNSIKICQ